MREDAKYQLWIAALAAVIFLTNLGATGLWDMDEALYTTCSREMFDRGDWVVPWFNGQMFPEKPPLMFWTMMAGFELFGVNEFGARFFSAIIGIGTALAAFHIGRILCSARVGFWTGIVTASTIIFTVSARAATVDAALMLATTLAFLFFVIARRSRSTWLPLALMYACVGMAVLAKGPVGMVLPFGAMGLYMLLADGWRNVLRSVWWLRPFTAIAVVAAVAVPWYVMVGIRTDGEWLRKFFIEFNLRPFKQPILGHGDGSSYFLHRTTAMLISLSYYLYHIPAILAGFFPWSILLGPTVVDIVRRVRSRDAWRDASVLALCWFGTWFVFWSICKTKLPHYLLPAYPALALLVACFIDRWQTEPASLGRWWLRNAWISMIIAGVGIAIAVPIVAAIYLPGEELIGLVGLILVVGGGWCWWKTAQHQHREALIGLTVTAVVFLTAMFGFAAQRVDRHQNARPIMAAIRADCGADAAEPLPPIAAYCFFRESTVYYAGHPITMCDTDEATNRSAVEDLRAFADRWPRCYVVTTAEYLPEIEKQLPKRFEEIFRQRRLLDPGEMVVLRAGGNR